MTAADNLKSYLSMARPAAPVQPSPKKRIVHQSLKQPLYVSDERKLGRLSPSVELWYKQVTDPSVPESDEYRHYILCGECESTRLFRQLSSLQKHRQKSCSARIFCVVPAGTTVETLENADTQPVNEEEDIDTLIMQAREYLESLSPEEIETELTRLKPISTLGLDKYALINMYLAAIIGEEPPPVSDDILTCDTLPDEEELVFHEAHNQKETTYSPEQAELITHSLDAYVPPEVSACSFGQYEEKANEILRLFPKIPSHLLAVALVGNILPDLKKAQTRTFGTQTKAINDLIPISLRSSKRKVERPKSTTPTPPLKPTSKPVDKSRDRRSRRLAQLRRRQ